MTHGREIEKGADSSGRSFDLERSYPRTSFVGMQPAELIDEQLRGMESYLDALLADRSSRGGRHARAHSSDAPSRAANGGASVRYLWPSQPSSVPALVLVPDISTRADLVLLSRAAIGWRDRGVAIGVVHVVPRVPHRWIWAPWMTENREIVDRREWLWRLATPLGEQVAAPEVAAAIEAGRALSRDPRVDPKRVAIAGVGAGGRLAALAGIAVPSPFRAVVVQTMSDDDPFGDRDAWDVLHPAAREDGGDQLLARLGKRLVVVHDVGESSSSAGEVPTPTAGTASGIPRSIEAAVSNLFGLDDSHHEPHVDLLPAAIARDQDAAFAGRERQLRRRQRKVGRMPPAVLGREEASQERLREGLRHLVGRFPGSSSADPPQVQLRLADADLSVYEVLLPVHPGSFLRGLLGVPAGLAPGERRPAIQCQHGWQGSPEEVFGPRLHKEIGQRVAGRGYGPDIYAGFAETLTRAGYVTWAPQAHFADQAALLRLYRKAVLLGGTDLGLLATYLSRGLDFVAGLPFVDEERLGFYGLSSGGMLALWYGALEKRLKVIVSSGWFNLMSSKLTDPNYPASYMHTDDRQVYVFGQHLWGDAAELGSLIFPRPLMLELGRDDTVTPYQWVMREYRRLRRVYRAGGAGSRLGLHWGPGGHRVFGEETIPFLLTHLPPTSG